MAGHLALEGYRVNLWNRTPTSIEALKRSKTIHVSGIITGKAKLELVSSNMEEVLSSVQLILITTPANAHFDLASQMANFLDSNSIVVLNPGRTFGALEFKNALIAHGNSSLPQILETQTIIYTCRKTDDHSVTIFTMKNGVLISGISPKIGSDYLSFFPRCISKYLLPVNTMLETSIGNVGMILHCAPVLMNTGWIENPNKCFKYYYDGITPSIAGFLARLDQERQAVSLSLGRELESTEEWLKRSYQITGHSLFECIQNNEAYRLIDAPGSLRHRYIFEDVSCGLVPLEAVGKKLGLTLKLTGLVIDLATELLEFDFRAEGRNLHKIGLANMSNEDIAKILNGYSCLGKSI